MIANLLAPRADRSATQRILLFNGGFSILCYTILFVILTYSKHTIYSLGSYKSWPVMLMILMQETIKVTYKFLLGDTSKELKLPKGRKTTTVKKIKLNHIFCSVIFLLVMFAVIFLVAVLLGAPFLESYEQTFMFSTLIVVLVVYPPIATIGNEATLAVFFGSRQMFTDNLCDFYRQQAFFTLFGAWTGAAAIPLDWDRAWQAWPIPCSVGALAGAAASALVGLVVNAGGWAALAAGLTGRARTAGARKTR